MHLPSDEELTQEEKYGSNIFQFYDKCEHEYELVRCILEARLTHLVSIYTNKNKLPKESIKVLTRVKNRESILQKLKRKNCPSFETLTDDVKDIVGARIVCWFLDDCEAIYRLIDESSGINIKNNSVENYIKTPKDSGYRAIHFSTTIEYDTDRNVTKLKREIMPCEVQIRTKLQDAFGDLTHEFHYKNGVGVDESIAGLLPIVAARLAEEDKQFIQLRNFYKNNHSKNI